MNTRPIAFLDSGIGGLPYLHWVRQRLPGERYIYLADTEEFPYGEKSNKELIRVVSMRIATVIDKFSPKLVVIACNTASVATLKALRERFSIPFVGVVPAVKPAAESSPTGKIGLFATNGTISDAYTDALIEEFASSCSVTRIGDGNIVDFIEKRYFDAKPIERSRMLETSVNRMRESNIDTLVIGCTHFIYIEDELQNALQGRVRILDSREGVGRQIVKLVKREGSSHQTQEPSVLYTTGTKATERYAGFSKRFGLAYMGAIED